MSSNQTKPDIRLEVREDGAVCMDVQPTFLICAFGDYTDQGVKVTVSAHGDMTDAVVVGAATELLKFAGYIIARAEGDPSEKAKSYLQHIEDVNKTMQEHYSLENKGNAVYFGVRGEGSR